MWVLSTRRILICDPRYRYFEAVNMWMCEPRARVWERGSPLRLDMQPRCRVLRRVHLGNCGYVTPGSGSWRTFTLQNVDM